jgi:peptide/nickel transport system substrate-binding protein
MSGAHRWLPVLGIALSVACGPGASDQPEDLAKTTTLTVLNPGGDGIFGPDWPAKFLVFLPLIRSAADGSLEGQLAQSWEHTPDYRSWVFHLRSGLKWHDGEPVTARDVKFSLDLLSHPEVQYDSPGRTVTVVDDTTVDITYESGGDALNIWTAIYPKHRLETLDPADFFQWEFWNRPVGSGPYRFVKRIPETAIELEANPDYFAGAPTIDRVVLKIGQDYGEASGLVELLSGNVDAIPYVKPADLVSVDGRAEYRTNYSFDAGHLAVLAWNQVHPALADRRVRQALSMAIDRTELRSALNLPGEIPIFDVLLVDRAPRHRVLPEPLSHNPSEARRLLDEAGWRDRDGDGVREKAGDRLHLGLVTSTWQQAPRAAVIVQAKLREVGVAVEVRQLDLRIARETVREGEFDVALIPTFPIAGAPLNHGELLGEGGILGWDNRAAAALLDSAAAAISPERQEHYYRQLWRLLSQDMPVTVLYPAVWLTVSHRRVRGLSSPWRADPLWYAGELWLEGDE